MSTWKSASENAEKPSVDNTAPATTDTDVPPAAPATRDDVEIVSLEVDLEAEPGGDPYNSTGKHLVEHLRRHED